MGRTNPGPRAENAKKTDKLAGSLAKMAERMPKSRKRNKLSRLPAVNRSNWWLETAYSATNFCNVNNNGTATNNNAANTNIRVPLCFLLT